MTNDSLSSSLHYHQAWSRTTFFHPLMMEEWKFINGRWMMEIYFSPCPHWIFLHPIQLYMSGVFKRWVVSNMAGVSANSRNQIWSSVGSARKTCAALTITIVKNKECNSREVPEEHLAKILYVILKIICNFCNWPQSLFFINAWAFELELAKAKTGIWSLQLSTNVSLNSSSFLNSICPTEKEFVMQASTSNFTINLKFSLSNGKPCCY